MGLATYWQQRADRRALRRAPPARGFALEPEPLALGHYARGRQIAAGSFHLAGAGLDSHDPFAALPPSAGFAAELHGWGWLDHLAACGDAQARTEARRWLADWIARHTRGPGLGRGPAWQPDLTGRRVTRWLMHALLLTAGAEPAGIGAVLAALGMQAEHLRRSHARAAPGLPRIEALTGWVHAALMLRGIEDQVRPALAALTVQAEALIGPDGGIASRCPEDLLAILTHLGWCSRLATRAGQPLPEALVRAQARATLAVRVLRHADGGMARFHGGGAGPEGQADRTLAQTGAAPPAMPRPRAAMGFQRLEGGRTTIIVDAAPPPGGDQGGRAQASTLAFELTSGRRPVVVGSGPGQEFGAEWDSAARATSSHSTLSLDGLSSSRFEIGRPRAGRRAGGPGGAARLLDGPCNVTLHRSDTRDGSALLLGHDGWVATHGLTHARSLDLSPDGRMLLGSDSLDALTPDDQRRLTRALAGLGGRGIGFALRFHLHPEADPTLDMNGRAVSIGLPSGEVWVFRFDATQGGPARLSLEPSVWLEPGRRAPRPGRQIVLRAALTGESARINWTLAKGHDTPLAIRDIGRDEDLALPHDFFDRD